MKLHSGENSEVDTPTFNVTTHATIKDGVCITCIIENNINSTCLLLIHQKASYLSSYSIGLLDIKTMVLNRSGDYARGCIGGGISHTNYIVVVFLYDTEGQMIHGHPHIIKPEIDKEGKLCVA